MNIFKLMPRKIWSFLNVINSIIPKNEKKIFIYSNLGFRDNVKALYDYLIKNNYNKQYKIICSLNDYKKYSGDNVKFTGNISGIFSFFTSRYVFYSFGKYPVKPRRGQKVFNLWHGMPLKRIGNMVSGYEKTDYNYFTHILCTSEFFRDIMKKSFNCTDDQIFICGQPRTDIMLKNAENNISCNKKLLLWLPTYRDGGNELNILSAKQFKILNDMCSKYKWEIIIKLHPLSCLNAKEYNDYQNIKIISQQEFEKNNISLYTLLGRSQCLITDYSSVYFDYLLLDRPIGFAVRDMNEYGIERGFVLENPCDYMPGEIFSNGENMLEFIKSVFIGQDEYKDKRKKFNDTFNRFQDFGNCRRILEAVGIKELE